MLITLGKTPCGVWTPWHLERPTAVTKESLFELQAMLTKKEEMLEAAMEHKIAQRQ